MDKNAVRLKSRNTYQIQIIDIKYHYGIKEGKYHKMLEKFHKEDI